MFHLIYFFVCASAYTSGWTDPFVCGVYDNMTTPVGVRINATIPAPGIQTDILHDNKTTPEARANTSTPAPKIRTDHSDTNSSAIIHIACVAVAIAVYFICQSYVVVVSLPKGYKIIDVSGRTVNYLCEDFAQTSELFRTSVVVQSSYNPKMAIFRERQWVQYASARAHRNTD